MLAKRTVLSRVEIEPQSGSVFFKLEKQIVEGDVVVSAEPHRSVVDCDVDPIIQVDLVNNHLRESLRYPEIGSADIKLIVDACASAESVRAAARARRQI